MALSGRDLAILSARFGVARFGASRFGFCPDDVEGTGADEPGEYVWKEQALPTTTWTLQSQCEGNVCGWKPVASFTATPESGTAPLEVAFTDTSTPTGDIDTWAWDFGDGETSTEQNPTHTFASAAVYTVTLTVTNGKGSGTTTGTVTATATTGTVSGTVTLSGSPFEGATVTLTPGGAEDTSAADGTYSFSAVDPGAVDVEAVGGGGSGVNDGVVVAGETLVLDIEITVV